MMGFLGNMMGGQMGEAMKQAKIQQDRLKKVEIFGESKDHLVKVHINGLQEVINITIDDVLLQPSKAKDVKKGIIEAFKNAQEKLQKELVKGMDMEQMKKMLGM
ncbi:MAG: YbaB/EbfC family nucleoid-associated protein [Candidatus Dojkabacteria bacterium]|nr:MAG: YbaB/EbfC family nucleoid-associated protein [Candidatus Dojkabacteria bacterium]